MSENNIIDIFKLRLKNGLATSNREHYYIQCSAEANTCAFLTSENGDLIGYLLWASISDSMLELWQTYGYYPSYPYEWLEGNNILLLDVLLCAKNPIKAKYELKRQLKLFDRYYYKKNN